MSKDPDVTKLPKWAQSRIKQLEGNVEYWRKAAATGPADSNVRLQKGMDGVPLEQDATVVFRVGGADIVVGFQRGFPDGVERLEIYAGQPWHHLNIEPSSSNVAYVTNRDKYGRGS